MKSNDSNIVYTRDVVTILCVMFWGGSFMRYVWTSGEGEEIPQKPRCLN